jgi:hypothetical protein
VENKTSSGKHKKPGSVVEIKNSSGKHEGKNMPSGK